MYRRSFLVTIMVILVLPIAYPSLLLNKIKHVEINKSESALGIEIENLTQINDNSTNDIDLDKGIINIVLFGRDRRKVNENGRSDAIIIFSIDHQNKVIKASSIMRDLLVPIDGHGQDKINHAYSYGGPQLAIKTMNQNFGTNIRDFIAIDFDGLEKTINALGGLEIYVQEDEMPIINDYMDQESDIVKKSGLQLLNGRQVLAYVSNRKHGNGDFDRIERQNKVLKVTLEKVNEQSLDSLPAHIAQILPYIETSMDKSYILSLAIKCLKQDIVIEHKRFPLDGYWKDVYLSGIYYIKSDLNTTKKQLNDFIYGENPVSNIH